MFYFWPDGGFFLSDASPMPILLISASSLPCVEILFILSSSRQRFSCLLWHVACSDSPVMVSFCSDLLPSVVGRLLPQFPGFPLCLYDVNGSFEYVSPTCVFSFFSVDVVPDLRYSAAKVMESGLILTAGSSAYARNVFLDSGSRASGFLRFRRPFQCGL